MKNQVSGPVAIVAVGAEVARVDFAGLYQFAAIVSINLAVVNALPLPALDGGYMALLVRSDVSLPGDLQASRLSLPQPFVLSRGLAWLLVRTLRLRRPCCLVSSLSRR